MNTHESYVSLEVAKLLKRAGFKWFVGTAYRDGVMVMQENALCDNFNGKHYEKGTRHEFFSAPTLDVAQRWLREVKRIFITVSVYAVIEQGHEITDSDKFSVYAETWDSQSKFWNKWTSIFEINDFNTYEEAQEAGIKKALEVVLEKGE